MKKLWIDDIRKSPDDTWIIAKNSNEAIYYIESNGLPDMISFDHDLGDDDTSMIIIKYIINSYLDGMLGIPEMFTYRVHSANPVGAKNIIGYMDKFLEFVEKNA